jgi:hypothetical protein
MAEFCCGRCSAVAMLWADMKVQRRSANVDESEYSGAKGEVTGLLAA